MVSTRNRIIDIVNYLESIGIAINIGKNKARGNKGLFIGNSNFKRIDISKDLSPNKTLSVIYHEFAHYIHYANDKRLKSLDFIFGNNTELHEEIMQELINVTVDEIPKDIASALFEQKEELNSDIKFLDKQIKKFYSDFKRSDKFKPIEKSLKIPEKYLLKYDKIKIYNKLYSIENIENDFEFLSKPQIDYIRLKSKQRRLARVNSRIARLNRYYNSESELFARFTDLYFSNPQKSAQLAPISTNIMDSVIKSNKFKELTQFASIIRS